MQFTIIFAAAFLAGSTIAGPLGGDIAARQDAPFTSGQCSVQENCCYSSESACIKQIGVTRNQGNACQGGENAIATVAMCADQGVSTANCTADCCRIDTATGRNCPPKSI